MIKGRDYKMKLYNDLGKVLFPSKEKKVQKAFKSQHGTFADELNISKYLHLAKYRLAFNFSIFL